jgi:excisionase family DNA binding protein
MIEKQTEITGGWGEYEFTLKGVKGYECNVCGTKLFKPEEIQMVQNLSKALADSNMQEKPTYLNVTETADLLRVSMQTVYNMIKSVRLPAVKFGREWRFLRKNIESMNNLDLAVAARNATTNSFPEDKKIIDSVCEDMKRYD